MKVLFVSSFVPWPLVNGGKTRTYHLIRSASRRAEIHLRIVREPDMPADFEQHLGPYCTSIEVHERDPAPALARLSRPKIERWFHSSSLAASLAREIESGGCDLVHLDELLLARVPPAHTTIPIVQHHHKLDTVFQVETASGSWPGRAFDGAKLRWLEAASTRRTRHHILCSEDDARVLGARHGPLDTRVVPSGFDPDVFRPAEDAAVRSRTRMLYLGSMDYAPNVDGVLWFAREILPRIREQRPEAELDIVGGNPTAEVRALEGDGIRVHGRAESVLPWLHGSAFLAVPLRIGGGTRLKIAEALGAGTPVLSTTIGAQGLGLVSGEHVVLADEPESFARAAARLLADPEGAARLAKVGRAHALGQFTWEALGDRLVDAWERASKQEDSAR